MRIFYPFELRGRGFRKLTCPDLEVNTSGMAGTVLASAWGFFLSQADEIRCKCCGLEKGTWISSNFGS